MINQLKINFFKCDVINNINWEKICELIINEECYNSETFLNEFIDHIPIYYILGRKVLSIDFILKNFYKCPYGFIIFSDLNDGDRLILKNLCNNESLINAFNMFQEKST